MRANIFTLKKFKTLLPFIVLFVLVAILLLIASTNGHASYVFELFIF